jgi:hypothetical protein
MRADNHAHMAGHNTPGKQHKALICLAIFPAIQQVRFAVPDKFPYAAHYTTEKSPVPLSHTQYLVLNKTPMNTGLNKFVRSNAVIRDSKKNLYIKKPQATCSQFLASSCQAQAWLTHIANHTKLAPVCESLGLKSIA